MATCRGALIVFEGCDRVGKSTQINLLMEALKSVGIKSDAMRFPDRNTPIGISISNYLKSATEMNDRAIHLLFAANRWEARDKILTALQNNITVVVDRYAASGACYSAAKGLGLDWCCAPDVGLPAPDLTIYLRAESTDRLLKDRPGFGDERYETTTFQAKVANQFDRLYELDQASGSPTWLSVDAAQSPEEVHAAIWQTVNKVVANVKPQINTLWQHLNLVKP